ncbi:MAG TPA: helix-turn-helix domain-containing protein [Chloroflexota bacterium]|nr:helix-turn-helix domain-containing protein [Chloroflexota bacterium]
MVNLTTLTTLEALEMEMAQTGRGREEAALREAVNALARPERGFLTTGQAAEKLGVSIPTIKRWIERGTLAGGALGGRWVVAQESVARLLRLRESLCALDQEGNPTSEEVRALFARARRSSASRHDAASGA